MLRRGVPGHHCGGRCGGGGSGGAVGIVRLRPLDVSAERK